MTDPQREQMGILLAAKAGALRNLEISLGYICHNPQARQAIIQDIEYLIGVKLALHEHNRTTE